MTSTGGIATGGALPSTGQTPAVPSGGRTQQTRRRNTNRVPAPRTGTSAAQLRAPGATAGQRTSSRRGRCSNAPECQGFADPKCTHHMDEPCCKLAQLAQGVPCDEHDAPTDHDDHQSSGDDSDEPKELELPEGFKILRATNPKMISCAYSMISLQQATASAAELLDRKIDLWLTTHSKWIRDADEVEHLRMIAINTLVSPLVTTHPNDLIPILAPALRRIFSHIYVRPNYGVEGMKAYETTLIAEEEDPDGQQDALAAAVAAHKKAVKAPQKKKGPASVRKYQPWKRKGERNDTDRDATRKGGKPWNKAKGKGQSGKGKKKGHQRKGKKGAKDHDDSDEAESSSSDE